MLEDTIVDGIASLCPKHLQDVLTFATGRIQPVHDPGRSPTFQPEKEARSDQNEQQQLRVPDFAHGDLITIKKAGCSADGSPRFAAAH